MIVFGLKTIMMVLMQDSKTNSFSMAKSYVSGLLGKAIMEGHIESLDQPVIDFIPEFSERS